MTRLVQHQLLGKILKLIQKIKAYLQELGFSRLETTNYFASKIFRIQELPSERNLTPKSIQKHLQCWLRLKQGRNLPIKAVLIDLLTLLEIENGLIIQYESFSQKSKILQQSCLKQARQPVSLLAQQKRIKQFCQEARQQKRESSERFQLPQISILNKIQYMNECFKEKMLKLLIQRKMAEELQYSCSNQVRNLHNMLGLQSS